MVHVSRLDVGAAPAALNLGLTFRGCYYHVLASYTDARAVQVRARARRICRN